MSFLDINNVKIKGVAACVPDKIVDNMDYELLSTSEKIKYIETTGIRFRHVTEEKVCTSDLCEKAAEKLICDLQWNKNEIGILIFVSQTPDYKMPSTACVLQNKLGLSNNCLSFDISLGCTAYVYGLATIASIISSSKISKGLLLVGNTQSKNVNYKDKSSYLLFGDAGTATALEFNDSTPDFLKFNLKTYGEGMNSIIIPDGAYRNPITAKTFVEYEDDNGNFRTNNDIKMDGLDVFSFVVSKVPFCFKELHENFNIIDDNVDYYLLHHANKSLCEKLRKKLKYPEDKVPYNIENYGNSSGASIPLLMVTNISNQLINNKLRLVISGFGVGLSVGTAYISTNKIMVSELQTI